MKRRMRGTSKSRSEFRGMNWSELGQDGGTEWSAWRNGLRSEDAVETEQGNTLPRCHDRIATRHRRGSAVRTCVHTLFQEGLMAPIFLGSVALLPLLARLIGIR